ncbi:MAG: helix-hairpin-helix domain-containing protein [Defluviitaleaceae bacterium]|nr:helix-hairpin-helix domain-containing protein [Defluviitaleaceae bacterium]
MQNLSRMKELATLLNVANRAYYQEDREIISNLEYDNLYDELVRLEAETGVQLAGSPTRKVGYEVVSGLKKAAHDTPLLSLDKTKSPETLVAFLGENEGLLSWKLDGLTIILRYENGELVRALTRGNGHIGEDVTHNARVFTNVPLVVPYKGAFDLRGEAVISIADFDEINETGEYKNPRNLCSGAVRQLNSESAAQRRVKFFAFALTARSEPFPRRREHVTNATHLLEAGGDILFEKKSEQLAWIASQGFELAEFEKVTAENVVDAVAGFRAKIADAPLMSDGLVLTYDDILFSASLGTTSKFPRDSLAFKWADEIAETTLLDVEWNTSRTGLVNPVAIFEPVEIEGTVVSRASLHNVSILRGLGLRKGDRISVYKANMIIPQVAENLSAAEREENEKTGKIEGMSVEDEQFARNRAGLNRRGNPVEIPLLCPECNGATEIIGDPETLYCTSPNCPAQLVRGLSHFVSRDALNIAGLSEQTLEKFASRGFVTDFIDLFSLEKHKEEILQMEGFGEKSYENLILSIEAARDVNLPNFIYALGIRHVGLANAKLLCTHFSHELAKSASDTEDACPARHAPSKPDATSCVAKKIADAAASDDFLQTLSEIKGFGEAISYSLHEYFSNEKNYQRFTRALKILRFPSPTPKTHENRPLEGLTFVITGDVTHFKNRKELQTHIENAGGRVTGSVTAKTSFLINNDAQSSSSKNKKAAELNVPVITENDFVEKFSK